MPKTKKPSKIPPAHTWISYCLKCKLAFGAGGWPQVEGGGHHSKDGTYHRPLKVIEIEQHEARKREFQFDEAGRPVGSREETDQQYLDRMTDKYKAKFV